MKPVLQALVLADRIYTDHPSGKRIICGTFNAYNLVNIPSQEVVNPDGTKAPAFRGGLDPGSPSLYINLVDVVSGTEITVQFLNLKENLVIFETQYKIESAERLSAIEIIAPLPSMVPFIKTPGIYSFDVLWKGDVIGSHRLTVSVQEQPKQGEET